MLNLTPSEFFCPSVPTLLCAATCDMSCKAKGPLQLPRYTYASGTRTRHHHKFVENLFLRPLPWTASVHNPPHRLLARLSVASCRVVHARGREREAILVLVPHCIRASSSSAAAAAASNARLSFPCFKTVLRAARTPVVIVVVVVVVVFGTVPRCC